ncbi:unnamed protein product, partial [Didymodactylos carnosus]
MGTAVTEVKCLFVP